MEDNIQITVPIVNTEQNRYIGYADQIYDNNKKKSISDVVNSIDPNQEAGYIEEGGEQIFTGKMGYVVLQPQDDKDLEHTSFANQIGNKQNIIFEIKDVFDLSNETDPVTIPANCALKFNGGLLKNGTIEFDNTYLEGNLNGVFDESVVFIGTCKNFDLPISLFTTVNNNTVSKIYSIVNGIYLIGDIALKDIEIPSFKVFDGKGYNVTNIADGNSVFVVNASTVIRNMTIYLTATHDDTTPALRIKTVGGDYNVENRGIIENVKVQATQNNRFSGVGILVEPQLNKSLGYYGGVFTFHTIQNCFFSNLTYGIKMHIPNDLTYGSLLPWFNSNEFNNIFIYYCKYGIYLYDNFTTRIQGNSFNNIQIQEGNDVVAGVYWEKVSTNSITFFEWDYTRYKFVNCVNNRIVSNKEIIGNTGNQIVNTSFVFPEINFGTPVAYIQQGSSTGTLPLIYDGKQSNLLYKAEKRFLVTEEYDNAYRSSGYISNIFNDGFVIFKCGSNEGDSSVTITIDFGDNIYYNDINVVFRDRRTPKHVAIYNYKKVTENGEVSFTENLVFDADYSEYYYNKGYLRVLKRLNNNGSKLKFVFTLDPALDCRIGGIYAAGPAQYTSFIKEYPSPLPFNIEYLDGFGNIYKNGNDRIKLGVDNDANLAPFFVSNNNWIANKGHLALIGYGNDSDKPSNLVSTDAGFLYYCVDTQQMKVFDGSDWVSTDSCEVVDAKVDYILDMLDFGTDALVYLSNKNEIKTIKGYKAGNGTGATSGSVFAEEYSDAVVIYSLGVITNNGSGNIPSYIGSYSSGNTTVKKIKCQIPNDVTSIRNGFRKSSNLESLTLKGGTNVSNLQMFVSGCSNLTNIDFTEFNPAHINDIQFAFSSISVVDLDLSFLDISNCVSLKQTFYLNTKLETLNISSFDTSKVYDTSNCFTNCKRLTNIKAGVKDTLKVSIYFDVCNLLTAASVQSIIDWLYDFATNVPPAYSDSDTYVKGDVVQYDDKTYICISNINTPSSWNSSNWVQTNRTLSLHPSAISNYDAANGEGACSAAVVAKGWTLA